VLAVPAGAEASLEKYLREQKEVEGGRI